MKTHNIALLLLFALISTQAYGAGIVFSGEANGQFDLYKIDSSFANIQRLTHNPSNDMMPTISPDGKKIAFISDRNGANSIYIKSLLKTTSTVKNISVGMGAYANPSFSPDKTLIAVRYAPDPEAPLFSTKIVLLNIASHSQTIVIDSKKAGQMGTKGIVNVVDRPTWISRNLLAYTIIEYENIASGRISKSTIYMLDISKGVTARIAGGESYFGANGKGMGFKATMPSIVSDSEGKKLLTFVATRGAFSRHAMKYSLNGKGKGKVEINDKDFFGPLLFDGKNWIYGYLDDSGTPGIAMKRNTLNSKKEIVPFKGKALSPVLVP